MKTIGLIKDLSIIVDFIISIIASSIQKTNPELSNILFGVSAVVLVIAVICVSIEFFKSK